ncbi:MAG: transglutaminase family protein [Bryobacteraceae bacterium]|nr:transglutaminase family protein [Bryobacteraceae bacterium]
MIYQVRHLTKYSYALPVTTTHSELRLTPRELPWQHLVRSVITVEPHYENMRGFRDYFGNAVRYCSVLTPHHELAITAESIVEVQALNPLMPAATPAWEQVRAALGNHEDPGALQAFEFAAESRYIRWTQQIADYARRSLAPGRPILEAAADLSSRIHRDFRYLPESTDIDTSVEDVFRNQRGVCQDFAHLLIAMLRAHGLAARYVSGYLRSGNIGAEASHAWVSVFVPGHGWVDLDPTNDVLVATDHITLAWGRDYGDVTPVKGITLGGGDHIIEVEVRVDPLAAVPAIADTRRASARRWDR